MTFAGKSSVYNKLLLKQFQFSEGVLYYAVIVTSVVFLVSLEIWQIKPALLSFLCELNEYKTFLLIKQIFGKSSKVLKMKSQVQPSRNSHLQSYKEGKVLKAKRHDHHSEHESSEVVAYLNELQRLVPFMPKNKKLSNLEVISNVIEYIHDLREILGLPICDASCNLESTVPLGQAENRKLSPSNKVYITSSESSMSSVVEPSSLSQTEPSHHYRQPLHLISDPN